MKTAFPPIITQHSEILFLGTMPGEMSLRLGQYYGNRGNQFWKLLFSVMRHEFLSDYGDRVDFIKNNRFALWDVLQLCEREGSLDSKIVNEVPNDFNAFYKSYPKIKAILFTSKNAAIYFDKYAERRESIAYFILPSPSGANASMRFEQKLEIWQKKILPLLTS